MSDTSLLHQFEQCSAVPKTILAVLAIAGEPLGRTRLGEQLDALSVLDSDQHFADCLAILQERGLTSMVTGRGTIIKPEVAWPAIRAFFSSNSRSISCLISLAS